MIHKHPYFDLLLHDDSELSAIIGGQITERITLHEWPGSCVQKIVTDTGQWVYKSQRGHSVEAEFYANARSPLLPAAQTIYQSNDHFCLLIDYIAGDLLEDAALNESEAVQIGKALIGQIRQIRGVLPRIYDANTVDSWTSLMNGMSETIRRLIKAGTYHHTTEEHVQALQQRALSSTVCQPILRQTGFVHGDFTGDNIFRTATGYRVIDWAYPRLGPPDIDLAQLMESLGFDPLNHVAPGIVVMMYCMRIKHFVEFTTIWFPDGAETYDQQVSALIERITAIEP